MSFPHHLVLLWFYYGSFPTFQRVLVPGGGVHGHELGPVLQKKLVVLPHSLFEQVVDELVLHETWTAHQHTLHHCDKATGTREVMTKLY